MLKFKPVDLDVLLLDIVLLLALSAILWGLFHHPRWTVLGSAVIYVWPGSSTGTCLHSLRIGSWFRLKAPRSLSALPAI